MSASQEPGPGPRGSGWVESTEGDLDPDLADEAGSSLDDWGAARGSWWTGGVVRAVSVVLLAVILGGALAAVLLAR